jgi:outer membrane protein OmpA-like peptidoglycan-associated protein
MKSQIVVAIFLSSMLTPATWAQTNSNSSNSAASMQSSDRERLQEPSSQDFWDGDDPNLVNLVTHPFARKKYVLRHTQPIKDRLNELDQITAENTSKIHDVDSRSQQGIQLASEKVSVADQHASDANTKAQTAQTSATQASTKVASVEEMVGSLDQYKGNSQTEIRFRTGQSALSKDAKDALDQMAESLKNQRSYIIEVRGFASGHGQTAIANSQKMADSVMRYFVLTHGIPVYRIYVLSMGNPATGEGTAARHANGGRVEVSVLQNAAGATAQK